MRATSSNLAGLHPHGRYAVRAPRICRRHTPCHTAVLFWVLLLAAPLSFAAEPAEPIQPIPQGLNVDPARAELGRRLFNDGRLSASGKTSCASCHDLSQGGADGRDRGIGFAGERTAVNVPTVLNAALNFRQFWDGRADSLEAQIDAVIQNPVEMGSQWAGVVARVAGDPGYAAAFTAAYDDGVTPANIRDAIASYERTLLTPNAPFDRYLRGERDAIGETEKLGYAKFKQYGCIACHQGINVGGNMFQKFGVMSDYFATRGETSAADLGRYQVTGDEDDRHVFKVPSLRNVALTAPYFHDASAATLAEAVDVMFRVQLGRLASPEDKAAIVAFLMSLTGETGGEP